MASGKKGKKTKGKTLALTDFLQETTGSIPAQPIRKSNINWADEVEDFDGYDARKPVNVVLPTAPKASRNFDDFSDKVPQDPPYIAYLSNLPYDVDEDEIAAFFNNMRIANMRIPKDDRSSEGPRSKGYGYIEFEDRESLLEALVLRDTTLKNRRMRIEVAANADNDRRRGGRMDMGRDRSDRMESFGDWRSGPRTEPVDNERRGGFNREGFGREREGGFTREGMRSGDREERSFSRDNMRDRDSGFNRDNRDGGFTRDRDSGGFGRDNRDAFRSNRDRDDDKPGGWRDGDRVNRDQDKDRAVTRNFRDSDRESRFNSREDRGGFGGRRFDDRDKEAEGFSRGRDDRDPESASSEARGRPKLVLAPRTKPVENVPVKTDSVPSASIFGDAKPVDTRHRELEIEERIMKEQADSSDKVEGSKERRIVDLDGSRDRKALNSQRDDSKDRKHVDRESSNERKGNRPEDAEKGNIEEIGDVKRIDHSPHEDSKDEPSPRKNYDDQKNQHKAEIKSPDKSKQRVEKPKKEEKRERQEKEMPKLTELEPPNFAASNKYAFLQTEDEDNSD